MTRRSPPCLDVHGVTVAQWTARFGVEPFSHPCACGAMLTTSIPFAQGQLRGLRAPPCENGCHDERNRPPYAFVRAPQHGDLFGGDMTIAAPR